MLDIAREYSQGKIIGWAEVKYPGLAKSQFDLLSKIGLIKPDFRIVGQTEPYKGKKVFLHQVVRQLLGKDTDNYPQEIGDCVSFGAKNAIEYLQCCEKLMKGEDVQFKSVFPPYLYGTGRVYVGGGRLGNSDGSLGSWMAEAVMKHGVLFSDEPNVPRYSGRVAKAWGDPNPRNDLDLFRQKAEQYPVKSAALVTTWEQLCAAIYNGYPVTIASNVGYSMQPSSDGFHRQTANWAHQMLVIGVDDNDKDPYGLILNSWGDVHGRLKDFDDGHELPIGVIRARRRDIEKHLRERESFAYSDLDHFPERKIDKELFRLISR